MHVYVSITYRLSGNFYSFNMHFIVGVCLPRDLYTFAFTQNLYLRVFTTFLCVLPVPSLFSSLFYHLNKAHAGPSGRTV